MAEWSISHAQGSANGDTVSVGATATVIRAAGARSTLVIVNADASDTLFVGGSGVTTANGLPIPAGSSVTITQAMGCQGAWYGIVASGTVDTRYVEGK